MFTKLWEYFGVIGIGSIVLWVVALYMLLRFALSDRRTRAYVIALALAVAALGMAQWNSARVMAIREDTTAEEAAIAAERDRVRAEARAALSDRAASVRFAEDADDDRLDLAGVEDVGKGSIYEQAAAGKLDEPAYRTRGKQERDAGSQMREPEAGGGGGADGDEAAEAPEQAVRRMPSRDVHRANRADEANLFMARLALLLALGGVAFDYLCRFNRTFDHLTPLPVAGRVIDAGFPRTHAVYLIASNPRVVPYYLEDVVRKGESFVYFGASDPLRDRPLHRISFGSVKLLPMRKVVYNANDPGYNSEFIFELTWFGRSCAVVVGADDSRALLADLMAALRIRRIPHARARKAVHLVWHGEPALDEPLIEELVFLCREANFKLVIASAAPLDKAMAKHFDEYFEA